MYHRRTTGFILLLAIFFSHVVPVIWSQHISGKDHTVHKSSLYDYQHVFSGFWQLQHLHKAVYLRHFGKETSQQISIHGNNFHQREYSFQDQTSLYGKGHRNLHDTMMSSAGEFPTTAEPLGQQQRR